MSSNEALKPCPFCGEDPVSLPSGNGVGLMVECINTKCPVGPHVSYIPPETAVAAWNTRSTDTPVCASTEEVVARVADFLNAFKADPFSTGADKDERLLEIVRGSSIPEPLIMPLEGSK